MTFDFPTIMQYESPTWCQLLASRPSFPRFRNYENVEVPPGDMITDSSHALVPSSGIAQNAIVDAERPSLSPTLLESDHA
jgi:hypothetical protein